MERATEVGSNSRHGALQPSALPLSYGGPHVVMILPAHSNLYFCEFSLMSLPTPVTNNNVLKRLMIVDVKTGQLIDLEYW